MEKRVSIPVPCPRVLVCPMARVDWNMKRKDDGMKEIGFMDDGRAMVDCQMEMATFMKVVSRTIINMERVS